LNKLLAAEPDDGRLIEELYVLVLNRLPLAILVFRDQQVLFRREIAWVRRCGRSTAECARPRCMEAIDVDAVAQAIDAVLARPDPRAAGTR